ncbi:MAG: zinc ribbon domain-containing protein [Candidatus Caccosoma sp.]|nr:zinc ribbon domain-containing protein [Candidatus Caccosoma sp.]
MHGLYNQQNLPYLAVKKCPKCNSLLPLDAKSCNNCQYSFIKNEMQKEETKKEEVKQNTEVLTKKEENLTIKSIYCDNCGNKVLISQKFCPSCGAKINKIICPNCGQIQDAYLKECTRCNKPLNTNELASEETSKVDLIKENRNLTSEANSLGLNNEIKEKDIINDTNLNEENKQSLINDDNKEIIENEIPSDLKEIVLMPRKRIFILLQIILVAIITLVCLFVPIVTKDNVYNTIFNLINKTATDSIITGKECIKLWISSPNDFSIISKFLVNENGNYLISSLPFASSIINSLGNIEAQVSFYAISSFYLLTLLASLITLLSSIIGFFNSKPFHGKSICFLMISLLIGAIIIQPNCIIGTFKNYDCWILYGFALSFLFWFIIKIVFFKENRIYKKKKKEIKMLNKK